MSNGLFQRAFEIDSLFTAWAKVRANGGGPGGDGMRLGDFSKDAGARLARLRTGVLQGDYRPGPLRRVLVPKRSGGTRPLDIPCVIDRIAQTAVAAILAEALEPEFEESSFAYRPGRSVRMAVDRISALRRQGYEWVVDGDIVRYFENVDHARLLDRLARHVPDPRLRDLIGLWLEEAQPDGRGLAQGSPLSPVLSNLYLDEVDERIETGGIRLVRFADDFVLLCKSEAAAEKARERMRALLAEHGLVLHPDKTRVVPFEEGFRFLGHLFVRSLVLASKDEASGPVPVYEAEGRFPACTGEAAVLPSEKPFDAPDDLSAQSTKDKADIIRPLYVMTAGRSVGVRNQAFSVVDDGAEILALPAGRVGRIEVGPHADMDAEAIRLALAWGVPVAFVDGWGGETGRVENLVGDQAGIHLAQAAHALDGGKRLDLAKRIVDGRLRNQQALLRRLNRRRKNSDVAAAAESIKRIRRKLDLAHTIAEAMGVEGEGTARYWPALGACLEHGWSLSLRRRQPPPDPVNLVVSWTASMLARDMRTLILRHGLHPGFGALHSARAGNDAAVADLIEEFRAPLSEGLTVYLFNNRFLSADDFGANPDGSLHITGEGGRTVVRGYEAWLDREVKNPRKGTITTWRGLMEEQILAYKSHVVGTASYAPYEMDY